MKGQSLNNAIERSLFYLFLERSSCRVFRAEPLFNSKNINIDNIFNVIDDRNSLQQAQITELTETIFTVSTVRLNDQQ